MILSNNVLPSTWGFIEQQLGRLALLSSHIQEIPHENCTSTRNQHQHNPSLVNYITTVSPSSYIYTTSTRQPDYLLHTQIIASSISSASSRISDSNRETSPKCNSFQPSPLPSLPHFSPLLMEPQPSGAPAAVAALTTAPTTLAPWQSVTAHDG